MPSKLQVPQWLAATASGGAKSACTPHWHLGALMSSIPATLHSAQQVGFLSALKPNLGCFPHLHIRCRTSTISKVLHSAHALALAGGSPGKPKLATLPHEQRVMSIATMPSCLQSLQQVGLPPFSAPLPQLHRRSVPVASRWRLETIPGDLQFAHALGRASPGRRKEATLPHEHRLPVKATMPSCLQALQQVGFPDTKP